MYRIIKRIINWTGSYKKRLYVGFIFSILTSIFTVMPIMGATYGLTLILDDYYGNKPLDSKWILYMLLFMIVSVFGRFIFSYLKAVYQESIGHEVSSEERIKIGDILKRVSLGFFDKYTTGELSSAVTTDFSFMEIFAMKMVDTVVNGYITAITMVVSLMFFNKTIALIALLGILLSAVFLRQLGNHSYKNVIKHEKSQENMVNSTIEYIRGLPIVKSFSEESGASLNVVGESFNESKRVNVKIEKDYVPFNCLHLGALKLASTFIVVISCYYTIEGTMKLPIMLMMTIFSFVIFGHIEVISDAVHVLQNLDNIMNKFEKIEEAKFIDQDASDIVLKHYDIEFKNVDFAYGEKKVLQNLTFRIPENTTTAIIGPSGGGKSTICNLITRFYDVNNGKITIDGIDVRNFKCDSLLSQISMVFQNVYLFNDTIKNNIKFGKANATEEEIINAAKKARCHDLIMSLPKGYDTLVGEGGSSLSGGEKQRISIARAILKDAPIIILDEATASIDPENEHYIQEAIRALTKGKTIITIAHRLKTIENADQILVINNGQIEQKGTHKDLIKKQGTYKRFIDIRKKSEAWNI